MTDDEKFDEIIQKCINDMMAIPCPVEDYRSALRAAIGELQVALEASEADPE